MLKPKGKDNSLILDLAGRSPTRRELSWLYNKLRVFTPYQEDPHSEPVTDEELFASVSELLNRKHFENLEERKKFVAKTYGECRTNLLAKQNFSWIAQKNSRLCLWLWCYMRTTGMITFPTNPSNPEDRHEDIIKYFDNLSATAHEKLKILKSLRYKWAAISNHERYDVRWLNKNDDDQGLWSLNYLKKKELYPPLPLEISELRVFIAPTELTLLIIDLAPDEQKGKLLENMKAAWAQKKARLKSKKNAANVKIKLPAKHLVMLDEISSLYGHKSPNETLKQMVEQELNKLKRSWLKKH